MLISEFYVYDNIGFLKIISIFASSTDPPGQVDEIYCLI